IPMWHGETVYFLSDRGKDGRVNLYSVPATGGEAKKLTDFKDFDVKFPSIGDGAIVFEQGGWLWKFDIESQKATKVRVRILEDKAGAREKLHSVSGEVTNFEINHDGSRAMFGARGDVFTVPAKEGQTRNLTGTPGVHERNAKFSPDGKRVA